MSEIFDVYTRNGEYLGTKPKKICHGENPGVYHKPVWIWIINSRKQILLQKRSKYKKNEPNKWDMSVAGHVVAGETSIDGAVRETREELGLELEKSDYEFISEYIFEKGFEIAQIYLVNKNIDIVDLKLDEREVSEAKWFEYDEFKKLFCSENFSYCDEEYRNLILDLIKDRFEENNE